MKITLADVQSINGYITQHDNPDVPSWSSPEDQEHFKQLIDEATVIIMGRTTYDLIKPRPSAEKLRIVMTHHPEEYAEAAQQGALEFTSESATDIAARLGSLGVNEALVVGGSHINSAFVEAGLATDAYITIEPKFFGSGTPLFAESTFSADCTLLSVKQCNERGTLLLHYQFDNID